MPNCLCANTVVAEVSLVFAACLYLSILLEHKKESAIK